MRNQPTIGSDVGLKPKLSSAIRSDLLACLREATPENCAKLLNVGFENPQEYYLIGCLEQESAFDCARLFNIPFEQTISEEYTQCIKKVSYSDGEKCKEILKKE